MSVQIRCMDATEYTKTLEDNSIPLFICDPPFGIGESSFSGARNKHSGPNIIPGYIEAPNDISYYDFCKPWLEEIYRAMEPLGTAYIILGWSYPLGHVMVAAEQIGFYLLNHIIWHYNTNIIPTKHKFSSSHYHILRLGKSKSGQTFKNLHPDDMEIWKMKIPEGRNGSIDTYDKMDVWNIPKTPATGVRNMNLLPDALIDKIILYSSHKGDTVVDLFSGNFTTCMSAIRWNRNFKGCELNENAVEYHATLIEKECKKHGYVFDYE